MMADDPQHLVTHFFSSPNSVVCHSLSLWPATDQGPQRLAENPNGNNLPGVLLAGQVSLGCCPERDAERDKGSSWARLQSRS